MFVAIDADEIGKQLELLLFSDNLEQAAAYSTLIKTEVNRLESYLVGLGCVVRFSGGDSILVEAPEKIAIKQTEVSKNGITWSVGIGKTVSQAALALKKAKALGRNRIEYYEA